ncbi:MAG: ChbG/HpnK family deacetylase, partial [Sarcina sp.]
MKTIIINADDFGMDESTTLAIVEAMELGLCSSTTLMVNMPFADEAVKIAKEKGFFDKVGIHLNLTEGKPLTENIKKLDKFCDENGNYIDRFRFDKVQKLHMSKREVEIIREELEAQIQKFLAYGVKNLHVDSHHHVHTYRPVWQALKPLIYKYNIKSLRQTMNIYEPKSALNRYYKSKYNKTIAGEDIKTTDFFGPLSDYMDFGARCGENSIIELMVHPKYKNNELVDILGTENEFKTKVNKIQNYNLVS